MTYLDLVNAVLRRLREEPVVNINESDYSLLIGDFVNDAKRLVEDAWDWTALRQSFPITTIPGQPTYSLTGFGVRSKIIEIKNETDNAQVYLESLTRIRDQNLGTDNAPGNVVSFAVDGLDSNQDMLIRFYQTPNSVKNFTVYGVKRPNNLTADTDVLLVPSSPVIQWAYAYALRERGETGGQSVSEQALFAQNDVATAISLDAAHHPEELIWNYV